MVEDHPDGPALRGAALELWRSTDHEVIIAGPAETGKTFAVLLKLDALLTHVPRLSAVLVRKVRDTIFPTALQTYYRLQPFEPGSNVNANGVRRYGGERPTWFDYPGSSRLWLAGLDDPGKALSSERDIVAVNQAEELTADDWQVLLTRATGRAGYRYPQVIGDCNPDAPHHWIKTRSRPGGPLKLLESRHEDNPALWDERAGDWTERGRRTLAVLDALTGTPSLRLRWGRWVAAEGAEWPADWFDHAAFWFDEWPADLAVKVLALDPSKGRHDRPGDYSAFVRHGVRPNGDEYVEADLSNRRDAQAIVADGVNHVQAFSPDRFACETNSFQELFRFLFEQEAARRSVSFLWEPVENYAVPKHVRIRRLTLPLAKRTIRFKRNSPGTELLVQQLRDFPHADFDDGPDALEMARRVSLKLWGDR